MRILVVSDSHGNETRLLQAHEIFKPVDLLIHCGDGEADAISVERTEEAAVLRVAGNCDLGSSAPRELVHLLQGNKLLICHGDRYHVKAGLEKIISRGKELGVDAILFGHTHLALVENCCGIMLVNPGTLFSQASLHSCALLEITDDGSLLATIQPLPPYPPHPPSPPAA